MADFTIQNNRWYGWQMLPGYFGERCVPYCCPIYVTRVTPQKTGKGILKIAFWNTGYAEGVQDFKLDLRLLHRASDYLVAQILYNDQSGEDRCAIVSHIEFPWIEKFCPHLWSQHPPRSLGSVSLYLDEVFGIPGT